MDEDCQIVSEKMSEEDNLKPPVFKQSRLPFSPIDSKCQKKRKLSPDKDIIGHGKPAQTNKKRRSSIKCTSTEKEDKISGSVIIIDESDNEDNKIVPNAGDETKEKVEEKENVNMILKVSEDSETTSIKAGEVEKPSNENKKDKANTGTGTPNQKKKKKVKQTEKSSPAASSIQNFFKKIEAKNKIVESKPEKSSPVNKLVFSSSSKEEEDIEIIEENDTKQDDTGNQSKEEELMEATNSSEIPEDKNLSALDTSCEESESSLNEVQPSTNEKSSLLTPKRTSARKSIASTPESTSKETPFATPKSISSTPTSGRLNKNKTPSNTPGRKSTSLTPSQLIKKVELQKKIDEKEKLRLEKEKLKKEKDEQKEKQKQERQKRKLEEIEVKQKQQEEKKLKKDEELVKKEEERKKREEERLKLKQQKEEERLKKEEEKLKLKQQKEDERLKKEEEIKLQEEEEKERKKKEKEKFTQFFMKKKIKETADEETTSDQGPFKTFRVKENMKMAPIYRDVLKVDQKKKLDSVIKADSHLNLSTYLEILKSSRYEIGNDSRTYPQEYNGNNECEILECDEDEDDMIDGTDVIEENKNISQKKIVKAKFLKFCENRRPAYYGTWSKKPLKLSGRNPLALEEVFDYEYDSDEDWEEEEAGESLSDSEGENENENEETPEEHDQYEVDNDFFVPHGYLSDDEGKDNDEEDEEMDEENVETEKKDEKVQSEQLKQKQAEFELEMKQKTKQLKPKVYGCVWMGDVKSHPAYEPLLKILSTHRGIVFWGSCPIGTSRGGNPPQEESTKDEDEQEEASTKKFVKTFPERAVPDLIRLMHGNRHSKNFLAKEFYEFWKKKLEDELGSEEVSGLISIRKTQQKIQELGTYGRYTEGDQTYKYLAYIVPKEVREKHNLGDLTFKNDWNYKLSPKASFKENNSLKPVEDNNLCPKEKTAKSDATKSSAKNLITKFTNVLSEEEKEELLRKNFAAAAASAASSSSASQQPENCEVEKTVSNVVNSPSVSKKPKKKAETPQPKNTIKSFFRQKSSSVKKESEAAESSKPSSSDCITLD